MNGVLKEQRGEEVTVPKWLWIIMGMCVLWAGYVTVQLTTLSGQVATLVDGVSGNRAVIEVIRRADSERAVLEYRVRQLELRLAKLEEKP